MYSGEAAAQPNAHARESAKTKPDVAMRHRVSWQYRIVACRANNAPLVRRALTSAAYTMRLGAAHVPVRLGG